MMFSLLDVAPSGYYAWLSNLVSNRAREGRRLLGLISASFNARQGVYVALRIFLDLRDAGEAKLAASIVSLGSCGRMECVPTAATGNRQAAGQPLQ